MLDFLGEDLKPRTDSYQVYSRLGVLNFELKGKKDYSYEIEVTPIVEESIQKRLERAFSWKISLRNP